MVQVTAKALEVYAAALHRYSM